MSIGRRPPATETARSALPAEVTGTLLGIVGQGTDTQYQAAATAQAPVRTLDTQSVTITAKPLPRA